MRESTLALKPRADVTRSPKKGYQWLHEKDLCPPKIKKNKKTNDTPLSINVGTTFQKCTLSIKYSVINPKKEEW